MGRWDLRAEGGQEATETKLRFSRPAGYRIGQWRAGGTTKQGQIGGKLGGRRPQGLHILRRAEGLGHPMTSHTPNRKVAGVCLFCFVFFWRLCIKPKLLFNFFSFFFFLPLQKVFCVDDFAVWCFYICKDIFYIYKGPGKEAACFTS